MVHIIWTLYHHILIALYNRISLFFIQLPKNGRFKHTRLLESSDMSRISQERCLHSHNLIPHLFLAKYFDNGMASFLVFAIIEFWSTKFEKIKIQTTSINLFNEDLLYSHEVFNVIFIETDNLFTLSWNWAGRHAS